MAFQPSVVEYFNNRKRPAVDDGKKTTNPVKVLVLEESSDRIQQTNKSEMRSNAFTKKLVYTNKEINNLPSKKLKNTVNKSGQNGTVKGKKKLALNGGCQMDIRTTLFKAFNKKADKEKDEPSTTGESDAVKPASPNVPFHIKGGLSPAKSRKLPESVADQETQQEKAVSETILTLSDASTSKSRKELNLGNIKAIMSRSSRLEEMKAALKRFNEKKAKLSEEQAGRNAEKQPLEGVKNMDTGVSVSPLKTPQKIGHPPSPRGKLTPSSLFSTPPPPLSPSPLKSPLKSPAFQRYQALVTEGRPALVLPFKYRALAELFRSVDTVASMMHNRRETITLSSLKPGVQELSRKSLTEYHLGQIKTLLPNAFEFTMEKKRSFGSTEKYELVITPLLSIFSKEGKDGDDNKQLMMGPSVLLARRRLLYNAILQLTMDYHEEFLRTLEPPMCIPRSRLTRWHPEFVVDDVPDIVSASLPQPPNVDRVTTAKDVLERARNMFVVNPRMERALKKVSENSNAPKLSPPTTISTTPSVSMKSALQGVPASILEKVRAKQAARALEAMTRTPAQAKEAVRLTRLPEIARIVRNLFVTEKKSVLPRDMVLGKLADSYRESLSHGELDDHLKLLAEKTPGWLTFCNLRKTDYVKLSRDADMNRIMTRLESLMNDRCI